jgi:hypothetical protein
MMSINHAGVEVAVHESQRYSLTKISANHPSVARGLVRWQFVALKFAVAERPFIGQSCQNQRLQVIGEYFRFHHQAAEI